MNTDRFYNVDTSATNFTQKKRKFPNQEELSIIAGTDNINDQISLRLESIENTQKELKRDINSMMKLLEKIYQAQLTTLGHQKLVSLQKSFITLSICSLTRKLPRHLLPTFNLLYA